VAEQFVKAAISSEQRDVRLERAYPCDALREHLPKTAPLLEKIAASYGTRKFQKTFARLYPKCENISIDYACSSRARPRRRQVSLYCIPASSAGRFGFLDGALRTSQRR